MPFYCYLGILLKLLKSLHLLNGLQNFQLEKINVTLMQYLIFNIYEMQKKKGRLGIGFLNLLPEFGIPLGIL